MNVFIETLGCPKNEADSRVLSGFFLENQHTLTDDPEQADLIIVNTCGFILDAADESIQRLIAYSTHLKQIKPSVKVMALGCLVQRYSEELMKEIPEIDYWVGLDALESIVPIVEKAPKGENIPQKPNPLFYKVPEHFQEDQQSYSYIKIGDGCNRACAFCSIPTFKGEHISRNPLDIKKEFSQLVETGKRELILVDQDITQYNYEKTGISQLTEELSRIEGDYWIRLMYMHPDHISSELFESLKSLEHLISYFDIPVQHGSDNVLKKMGRKRMVPELKEQIQMIRELFPHVSLRTTIMLGFPGEGHREFEELMAFMEEVRFDKVGFFTFSPEEGTPISVIPFTLENDDIIHERLSQIQDLQKEISAEKNEEFVGTKMQLIVDSFEEDMLVCRSYRDAPEIDSEVFVHLNDEKKKKKPEVGEFIDARITGYDDFDLEAEWLCD
ncbi:MAG: ribosomal protein methylthiotransferase [Thermotogaceae bacterium]|nr:ribosomal protein methylthiotransferase [Thermotogaceae bacterium]